jgi:hypothetical protein
MSKRKTRLFVAPELPGERLVPLLSFARGSMGDLGSTLFNTRLASDFDFSPVEFAKRPEDADFILVPHGLSREPDVRMRAHLDTVRALGKEHQKEIILLIGGDLSHNIFVDDMIVLKGSQYRYMKRRNEVTVPPFVEDFGRASIVRQKGEKPVVGFCGWAGFPTKMARARYLARNMLCDIEAVFGNAYARVHKKGLWFRRKAMRALELSPDVDTRFIVRTTFSGSTKTISLDPAVAREEYLRNMEESDFVLAPKGEGNFSVRFYEALAMGRIPVLIDTECCLAFEGDVPYDEIIVRVPWQEADRVADYIRARWGEMSDESYARLQNRIRDIYHRYIRYDAFFNRLFAEVLNPERAARGQTGARD